MNVDKMNKKQKTPQPKYNLWHNSAYMISIAYKNRPSVLWLCISIVLLSLLSNLVGLFITPVILQKVETVAPLTELIFTIIFFIIILIVLHGLTSYAFTNTLFGRIDLRLNIVNKIHNKLATTSYPNTEDTNVLKNLDKANMAVRNNSSATEAIWNTLTDLLKNIIGFSFYLILLSTLNPLLIIAVLSTTTIGYLLNKHINEWGYRHREEEAEYSKKLNYISDQAENINLAKDIRIFGMRTWLDDIYDKTQRLYQAFIVKREKIYIWANIVDIVLTFIRNGAAYWYLVNLTLTNNLSASQFLLYFAAVGGFTSWITGILSGFSMLHHQSIDISIVREFLETPEHFLFEKGRSIEPDLEKPYEIELKNVSFRYPNANKDTLKRINLTIKPGEKLAVVGLNGAGKTTLVKLICGFYDPSEGEVLLNGVNIKEYNRFDYYRLFTAVFQQFSILEVTLAENIAQTDENIDFNKVIKCIDKAGLKSKVESLPQNINTHIGRKVFEDGVELSGGETQRLMLARALYKDAPIIVLDEPTAALDSLAENDIYQKYNEMTYGRTSVYISHRLASTRFCDRIIFISNGIIAEEGTHTSLLKSGGKYAELFEIQSRYYKEGEVLNEKKNI